MPQESAGDESGHTAPARLTGEVTPILSRIESGDPSAAWQLLPLGNDELRKLAAAKMAQEKPDQTLQATALVHEAYMVYSDLPCNHFVDRRRTMMSCKNHKRLPAQCSGHRSDTRRLRRRRDRSE